MMESTLGSSTASTFRGVMSWLALRPRNGLKGPYQRFAESRSVRKDGAVGGPPTSLRASSTRGGHKQGITTAGGFVERRSSRRNSAARLHGGSPPSVKNEIATRGARALVRSGIRSDGERSSPDALVQFGAKAPCTEALALRGAAGWFLPAARTMGCVRGDSREVPEVLDAPTVVLADGLDCRNRSATFGSHAPR